MTVQRAQSGERCAPQLPCRTYHAKRLSPRLSSNQLQCALNDAITDARNLKRSDFAVALQDPHPAVQHEFAPACDRAFPHRRKKRDPTCGLNVLEALAVDARGTTVSLQLRHQRRPVNLEAVLTRVTAGRSYRLFESCGRWANEGQRSGPGPQCWHLTIYLPISPAV